MIINDQHKFCFIHIPKCAGMSVRGPLKAYDSTNGQFDGRVGNHSELGLLDYVHIPLLILKSHFIDEYNKVRDYYTFAVVRDPVERFSSSLTQRLKMYGSKTIMEYSKHDLMHEIDFCIEYLQTNKDKTILPPEFIHFQKQSSYIYCDGKQVVDKFFTVHQLETLFDELNKLTGVPFINDQDQKLVHDNKSVVYRSKSLKIIYKGLKPIVSKPIKAILSNNTGEFIRRLFHVPRDQRMNELFNRQHILNFIEDYYSEDITIYKGVSKRD